jgi:hypothetical protein
MKRRAVLAAWLASGAALAQPRETPLPTPASLQAAALLAQSKGEPLVLLVSVAGCPWCELLRRNYLAPMRLEGLQAFQIKVNDRITVVADFKALASTGADIADAYQAKLTPSVLFLNAQGVEIAPRIAGVASADLLGTQLDSALRLARERLAKDRTTP